MATKESEAMESAANAAEATTIGRMTLRRRRELGLTVASIGSVAKDLKAADPTGWKNASREDKAEMIAQAIATKNAKAYQAVGAQDWAALVDFIIKILPLIMALFGL